MLYSAIVVEFIYHRCARPRTLYHVSVLSAVGTRETPPCSQGEIGGPPDLFQRFALFAEGGLGALGTFERWT